ncbi:unnamed protein product [Meloidogyne enterolobii]|uniref:Uncharacterized protein n=1 Tax=Meloidogyne enterolobii TaxID=390850 RepID=A0ACB1AJR1_MELEN
MDAFNLDIFEVVLAVCKHLWIDKTKPTDLTKLIKFLALNEYKIIKLIEVLIDGQEINDLDELLSNLLITPCDALLLLTIIWTELEFPSVARLFEPYLTFPPLSSKITNSEVQQAEDDFNQLLDEHLDIYSGIDLNIIERFVVFLNESLVDYQTLLKPFGGSGESPPLPQEKEKIW